MLMRFDPFREVENLLRPWNDVRMVSMPLDAYRRGDDFFVEIDLPGVDAESIELTVERNVLHVSARREVRLNNEDQILVRERPVGEVTRQLFLGDGLDTDRIEASYDNGVLAIRLPVSDKAKPHRISIGTGNGHERKAVTAETVNADAGKATVSA